MAAACTKYQEKLQPDQHEGVRPCDAKRKKMGALDSCFGLVGPHSRAYQTSLSGITSL